MQEILYKPLSALQPVELRYSFKRDEKLILENRTYDNGLRVSTLNCLKNYQDSTINKNSCFVLTSAINLQDVINFNDTVTTGDMPTNIKFGIKNLPGQYLYYNPLTNIFSKSNEYTVFTVSPIPGTSEVELLTEGKWLQVSENYPFEVTVSNISLLPEEIHRQRFIVYFRNNTITFKTKTSVGYRYLTSSTSDGKLRATGTIMGNTPIGNYAFTAEEITRTTLERGLKTNNEWVTYFYDFDTKLYNTDLKINKTVPVVTNLLLDYPIEKAIKTGTAFVNIANLKTTITPQGNPATIENTTEI
jgi:hypothetical protein